MKSVRMALFVGMPDVRVPPLTPQNITQRNWLCVCAHDGWAKHIMREGRMGAKVSCASAPLVRSLFVRKVARAPLAWSGASGRPRAPRCPHPLRRPWAQVPAGRRRPCMPPTGGLRAGGRSVDTESPCRRMALPGGLQRCPTQAGWLICTTQKMAEVGAFVWKVTEMSRRMPACP